MSNYNKEDVYKNEADYYAALEGVPLVMDGENKNTTSSSDCDRNKYPGHRRNPITAAASVPPAGTVLLKTAGNALQAVPAAVLLETNVMAVCVPANAQPGDVLHLRPPLEEKNHHPNNNNSSSLQLLMMEAVVPEGAWPGHTFLVPFPDSGGGDLPTTPTTVNHGVVVDVDVATTGVPHSTAADSNRSSSSSRDAATTSAVVVVAGEDVPMIHTGDDDSQQLDLVVVDEEAPAAATTASAPVATMAVPNNDDVDRALLSQHQPNNNNTNTNLVLIKVPAGAERGSKIRVQLADGRTVDATVPRDPSVTEFYLRVPPKKQNWHDNPLAVVAAPFAYYMS